VADRTGRPRSADGAPAIGAVYADGQYWADVPYGAPAGAGRAEVRLYYQNTPREYIEHLREANHSDGWGQTLYNLWVSTGKGAPIQMAFASLELTPGARPTSGRRAASRRATGVWTTTTSSRSSMRSLRGAEARLSGGGTRKAGI